MKKKFSHSRARGAALANWTRIAGRSVSTDRTDSTGRAGLAALTRQTALAGISGQTRAAGLALQRQRISLVAKKHKVKINFS